MILTDTGPLVALIDPDDRMAQLMQIYSDAPVDLANAAMIAAAAILFTTRVFTLDKHFYAYRLASGATLDVMN